MKMFMLCLLACSLSGTLAISLIVLAKRLLKDKLSPIWHCYVWLLVMALLVVPVPLKLTLPETPQIHQEIVESAPALPMQPQNIMVNTESIVMPSLTAPKETESTPVLQETAQKEQFQLRFPQWGWDGLFILWVSGVAVFFGRKLWAYQRFVSKLKNHAYDADEETLSLLHSVECKLLLMKRPVKLSVVDLPITPMIVGFVRPTLFLPEEALSEEQLHLVFTHELCHYQYGDLLYKVTAMVLQGIHWFNPLCRFMVEDIDFSCELCCDRRVREHLGENCGKEYGFLILDLLRMDSIRNNPSAAFSMDQTTLKRRLTLIMKPKKTSRLLAVILSALLALSGVACNSVMTPSIPMATTPKEESPKEASPEESTGSTILEVSTKNTPQLGTVLGWVNRNTYLAEIQDARVQEWLEGCPDEEDTAYVLKMRKTEDGVTSTRFLVHYPWADADAAYDFSGGQDWYDNTCDVNIGKLEQPQKHQLLYLLIHDDNDGEKNIAITAGGQKLNLIIQEVDFYADRKITAMENAENNEDLVFYYPIDLDDASINAYLSVGFGGYNNHNGTDIAAIAGTEIRAAADGTVTYAGWLEGNGNTIIIDHGDDTQTLYAHCEELYVQAYETVTGGETVIATVGSSGLSTGNHLHFEITQDGKYVDPAIYLKALGTEVNNTYQEVLPGYYESFNNPKIEIVPGDSETPSSEEANRIFSKGEEKRVKNAFDIWFDFGQSAGDIFHDKENLTIDDVLELYARYVDGGESSVSREKLSEFAWKHFCAELDELGVRSVEKNANTYPLSTSKRVKSQGSLIDYYHQNGDTYLVLNNGDGSYGLLTLGNANEGYVFRQYQDIILNNTTTTSLSTYKSQNSDVVGWLQIPGTTIDEAVVQSSDNEFYNRHNNLKNYDEKGSYYADYECIIGPKAADLGKSTVIYGHNIADGERFGQLYLYEDMEWAKAHPYIYFSTLEDEIAWEVFAVAYVDDNSKFYDVLQEGTNQSISGDQMMELVKEAKNLSQYDYNDVAVDADDKILTLCTESKENHRVRFLVMAKMLTVDDQVVETANISINSKIKVQ